MYKCTIDNNQCAIGIPNIDGRTEIAHPLDIT